MTAIYHITHFDNLSSVIGRGALLADTAIRVQHLNPCSIAYGHIKERRSRIPVTIAPGGMVSDYVPFYFCPRSPMLYAIHRGQVPGYPGGQSNVLHLVADADALDVASSCVHTDGNAASQPLRFFSGTSTLRSALPWDVINSWSWHDTLEDNDRKRRKQAEFLVWQSVPWDAISRIGVIDETVATQVRQLVTAAAHRPPIVVCKDWYYT